MDTSPFGALLAQGGSAGLAAQAAARRVASGAIIGLPYDGAALALDAALASNPELAGLPMPRRRVLAIAGLLVDAPHLVARLALPPSVAAFYPGTLAKIAAHLARGDAYGTATDDPFVKDVRTAVGLSIPCGAQAVEIDDRLRLRSLFKHALIMRDPGPLVRLGRHAIGRHWFGIHTDTRDTSQFHEGGWTACYRRLALLLAQRPAVAGVVGTSWFFDPQLRTVTPRLAYLQSIPLDGGAIAIRNGPGAIHTERATATSEARRKLHAEGKYLPICYTIAWPREALIAWSRGVGTGA